MGGLAPGPGAFRRDVINGDPHALGLLDGGKSSFVKGIFVIDFQPLQGKGKSRPSGIPLTAPHPPLFAGVIASGRGLWLCGGKLEGPAERKIGHIEEGVNLYMGNIESIPYFGKAMNLSVQGQLIRDLEVRIVQ